MNEHYWFALATAFMDEQQAAQWAQLEGLAGTPLRANLPAVICIICGIEAQDAAESCPGTSELLHRWMATLALPLDDEEVGRWLEGQDARPHMSPQSTGVTCVLCGQPYEEADTGCPERILYAKRRSE